MSPNKDEQSKHKKNQKANQQYHPIKNNIWISFILNFQQILEYMWLLKVIQSPGLAEDWEKNHQPSSARAGDTKLKSSAQAPSRRRPVAMEFLEVCFCTHPGVQTIPSKFGLKCWLEQLYNVAISRFQVRTLEFLWVFGLLCFAYSETGNWRMKSVQTFFPSKK
jgi:hypothetical protein